MNQILIESLKLFRTNTIESASQTEDKDEAQALLAEAEEANALLEQFNNPEIRFNDRLATSLREAMKGSLCFDIAFLRSEEDHSVERYSTYLNAGNMRSEDEDEELYDLEILWADQEGDLYGCYFKNDDLDDAEKIGPGKWLVKATTEPELSEPTYKTVLIRTFSASPSDLLIADVAA